MQWSILTFGKHKGKSLPQVLFSDPDWFFWALDNNVFKNKGALKGEAIELLKKASNIKIPDPDGKGLVAEYYIHPSVGRFGDLALIPSDVPQHEGSSPTIRKTVIDMSLPRQVANYDKLGYKIFLYSLRSILFGSSKIKMTRKRAESFFNDDSNFEVD